MKTFHLLTGALLIGACLPALADPPVGAANAPRMTSPGPYDDFTKQVQEKLNGLGFDAGPVNGDFGAKTQAALAQYQLSMLLPASGVPDDGTLLELGIDPARRFVEADSLPERDSAAAGGTR
jgi:peptidoglycan hydrolase-like protein with peptidoglycan-binding domain